MKDIDAALLEKYATEMQTRFGVRTGAHKFGSICSALRHAGHLGLARPLEMIRPRRIFNLRDEGTQSAKPYSDRERNLIATALLSDLQAIRRGSNPQISEMEAVVVMLLLLAIRTGFNASSLLNLGRSALRPHPVRPDWHALVTLKRRAAKEVSVPVRFDKVVDEFKIADNSAAALYREILGYTRDLVAKAALSRSVWLTFTPPPAERGRAKGSSVDA